MTTIVSQFNPAQKEHVLWLKSLFTLLKEFNPQKKMEKNKVLSVLNTNPMTNKWEGSELDLPEVHMILSSKYAQAVLEGNAYIPQFESPDGQRYGPFGPIV